MARWPAKQGQGLAWLPARTQKGKLQAGGPTLLLHHHDGHALGVLDVLVHGALLTLANGTVIGWLASALDGTERQRAERLAARVRVGQVLTDALVGIRVEDSGPGVAQDQQARILDAFASHKPSGMGMGMGWKFAALSPRRTTATSTWPVAVR